MVWFQLTEMLGVFGLTWMLLAIRQYGWALPTRHLLAGGGLLAAAIGALAVWGLSLM